MPGSRSALPPAHFATLHDGAWEVIERHLAKLSAKDGRPCLNARKSLDGMRWVASMRKPWVDMPVKFGKSGTVRRYYTRLKKRGVIEALLTAFPKRTLISGPEGEALITARAQLACLAELTERRPRGRAAQAKRGEHQPTSSPLGDKPG